MREAFRRLAQRVADAAGSPASFLCATTVVILWGLSGPLFGFSDTWQLVINTGTTIITFLMVFLVQNTQNRDALAMHLKLDELILAVRAARNEMAGLEDLSDAELQALHRDVQALRLPNGEGESET